MKLRIPWKARVAAYVFYQGIRNVLSQFAGKKRTGANISFLCKYHQTTGSSVAIACIANQLASHHNIDAFIKPLSGYSRQLDLSVRQYFSPQRLKGEYIFVDVEQDNSTIAGLVADNNQVILSCHAFPLLLHNVPQPKLIKNLELSTYIHFVSRYQRSEFIRFYPQIEIESKSFVIPNYTRRGNKHTTTRNVGIVGHSNREEKNALRGIQLAQQSNANTIQCWGSKQVAGMDNPDAYTKLQLNGWTDNLQDIHNSFDVLLSTSNSETFGLVVVEALSAGIPCALSDIPVFRELYSECEGVVILSGDDQQDIGSINYLLEQAPTLKQGIIRFWEAHFSNTSVKSEWLAKIEQLTGGGHTSSDRLA